MRCLFVCWMRDMRSKFSWWEGWVMGGVKGFPGCELMVDRVLCGIAGLGVHVCCEKPLSTVSFWD